MNTECKDCKLREGDCGHHHRIDGEVYCDIPSLSSCDKYGNCGHFQQKETPKGDLISREALKKEIERTFDMQDLYLPVHFLDLIDNEPTVETDIEVVAKDAYDHGYTDGWKERFGEPDARPQGEWIENLDSRNDEMQASCYCSECGASCYCATDKFCHECGADMRGGAE